MNYDSDYEVRLATLEAMGGDVTKHYDSVYDIDLAILELTEQGGGVTKSIEEVDSLPAASEGKEQLYRLSTDGEVYVSELKYNITTNRLPDEQQINKAVINKSGECYLYKGVWKFILNDGEIDGYGWMSSQDNEWWLYLTEDSAVTCSTNTLYFYTSYDESEEIDLVNKTVTIDSTIADYDWNNAYSLGDDGLIPVPAIYNELEANQVGNASLHEGVNSYLGVYDGTQVTFIDTDGGGEEVTGYKWVVEGTTDYIATSKPASEIYYTRITSSEGGSTYYYYYTNDVKVWCVYPDENNSSEMTDINSIDDKAIYISQQNAPEAEQINNATINDAYNGAYETYTGEEITIEVEGNPITVYTWVDDPSGEPITVYSTKPASEIFNAYIDSEDVHFYYNDSGDIVELTFAEGDLQEISTVKYHRTEIKWGWNKVVQPTYKKGENITIDERNAISASGYFWDEASGVFASKFRLDTAAGGELSTNKVYGKYGSTAFGYNTRATGNYGSFAEGKNTQATNLAAHAEGENSIAQGYASHAEGLGTQTSNHGAHTEGAYSRASGVASHAEGNSTRADGTASHSEGESTITYNVAEHAEGRNNVSHNPSNTFGNEGNTIHSVGIGTGGNTRKNAVEVMQNGDYYLLGVGGYQGTDTKVQDNTIKTLQEAIASLEARIAALENPNA